MRGGHFADFAYLVLSAIFTTFLLNAVTPAQAGTIYANPGDDLRAKIRNNMSAGDTLILNPGTYTYSGATMLIMDAKVGNANAWFTIKALQPGTVIIKGNSGRNICEMTKSAYWRIENLELDGQSVAGDGIKCTIKDNNTETDWDHHIVINNVNIHHVQNACINTQVTVWDLTIQNCWLHDSGIGSSVDNPGPALYLGSPQPRPADHQPDRAEQPHRTDGRL